MAFIRMRRLGDILSPQFKLCKERTKKAKMMELEQRLPFMKRNIQLCLVAVTFSSFSRVKYPC